MHVKIGVRVGPLIMTESGKRSTNFTRRGWGFCAFKKASLPLEGGGWAYEPARPGVLQVAVGSLLCHGGAKRWGEGDDCKGGEEFLKKHFGGGDVIQNR